MRLGDERPCVAPIPRTSLSLIPKELCMGTTRWTSKRKRSSTTLPRRSSSRQTGRSTFWATRRPLCRGHSDLTATRPWHGGLTSRPLSTGASHRYSLFSRPNAYEKEERRRTLDHPLAAGRGTRPAQSAQSRNPPALVSWVSVVGTIDLFLVSRHGHPNDGGGTPRAGWT